MLVKVYLNLIRVCSIEFGDCGDFCYWYLEIFKLKTKWLYGNFGEKLSESMVFCNLIFSIIVWVKSTPNVGFFGRCFASIRDDDSQWGDMLYSIVYLPIYYYYGWLK